MIDVDGKVQYNDGKSIDDISTIYTTLHTYSNDNFGIKKQRSLLLHYIYKI